MIGLLVLKTMWIFVEHSISVFLTPKAGYIITNKTTSRFTCTNDEQKNLYKVIRA